MRSPFTFDNAALRKLHAVAVTRWPLGLRSSYGDDEDGPWPGFWLVGDEGVYIMSNGKAMDGKAQPVVYANECNPETMSFDAWWAYKNAAFGGDDGVEFIDRETVEAIIASGNDMVVEFTPTEITVSESVPS
jgi:hypothetical protein